MALVAGMEPHLLATGSEQDVKESARYILDDCASVAGRVLLGAADNTPYGSPARNLAAVLQVVEKLGA